MAFNNLTPVTIGDGDPVTADVLRKIVENINIIAKGETVTPVKIESTTINGGKVIEAKGLNTTIGGIIAGKTLKTDMKSFSVNFSTIGFIETPTINVTIEYAASADVALYTPYIINASKDKFNIVCRAPKGTKSVTTAKIHWTASGNTASLTE
jgi:hypothetical protein